jgi:Flp pilus assembly protein CpaB
MTAPLLPVPARRRERVHRAIRRAVLARRRPLAAACLAVAVLTSLHEVRPHPGPQVTVAVAARDLDSGTVLSAHDLVDRRYPAEVAPVGTLSTAVGRTLAAPVRAGEPVTDVRLVAPSLVSGYPGRVALPVRVADADAVGLLKVGDTIDLVAADPRRGTASYVAIDAQVLALPAHHDESPDSADLSGRLVVIAADPSEVDHIAGAAAVALLSVVITR